MRAGVAGPCSPSCKCLRAGGTGRPGRETGLRKVRLGVFSVRVSHGNNYPENECVCCLIAVEGVRVQVGMLRVCVRVCVCMRPPPSHSLGGVFTLVEVLIS